MQEVDEVVVVEQDKPPFYIKHLILRIPFYFLVGVYYFTFRYIVLIIARIYGIFQRHILYYRVKRLSNIMSVSFREARYEDAKNFCLRIIEIIPPVWSHLYEGYRFAILSLGSIYRHLGDLKEAERYIVEAKRILEEGDFYRMILVIYEGDFYADKGEFKVAEECYFTAYEVLKHNKEHENYKNLCFNLHNLYLEMGQIEKAEKFLKESR